MSVATRISIQTFGVVSSRISNFDHKSLQNPSANQSRKGRQNPEPGTAVPGKEGNGNQVPFRGRHNQLMMWTMWDEIILICAIAFSLFRPASPEEQGVPTVAASHV
jgi:hypothetical protein